MGKVDGVDDNNMRPYALKTAGRGGLSSESCGDRFLKDNALAFVYTEDTFLLNSFRL
jgi:hypothetical protein